MCVRVLVFIYIYVYIISEQPHQTLLTFARSTVTDVAIFGHPGWVERCSRHGHESRGDVPVARFERMEVVISCGFFKGGELPCIRFKGFSRKGTYMSISFPPSSLGNSKAFEESYFMCISLQDSPNYWNSRNVPHDLDMAITGLVPTSCITGAITSS